VDADKSITATFSEIVGVVAGSELPTEFALSQNYPNPFNPITTIKYDLPVATDVALVVYDLLGRQVVRLVDGYMEPGYRQAVWNGKLPDGREVPSGVYIARLVTPEYTRNIKMVLLK
ncbi:MAG: T9SS type A sorting domain-containing protein, partial [Candidatus Neomarinimicrobiota bacterium]